MNSINLTPVLQAVIGLLAALVTYRLIPWIKARTTNEQQQRIEAAVRVAVFAAEQLYGAGKGAEKLEYVRKKLSEKGFEVDAEQIEACVYTYLGHDEEEKG